ncbi:MAG: DUF4190 domain-containing protein [Planctomycetes bacterium]|nr:DUF4190 domain-containing protein [Planctomycetota bacterium]
MIRFKCTHCGMDVEVDDIYAGQSGPCPGCGRTVAIPRGSGQPASMTGAGTVPPPSYAATGQPIPAPEKTSRWAVASLVCGLLGCLIVPAIPGIIFGILGIRQVNRSEGRIGGMGLSIAGIVVSVVLLLGVGGFGGIYTLILTPNLMAAKEAANRARCASNLRSISQSIKVYSSGNRGKWPTVYSGREGEAWRQNWSEADTEIADAREGAKTGDVDPFTCNLSCWWVLIRKGMSMPAVFQCPSHDDGNEMFAADPNRYWSFEQLENCSYSYQNQLGKGTTDSCDAELVVAADRSPMRADARADCPAETMPWTENSPNHNFEGQNVLFADGHVEWMTTPEARIGDNNIWLRSTYDPDTETWTDDESSYDDPASQIGHKKDSFLVP